MISGVIFFLLIVCGGIFLFFKHAKITRKIDAVADSTDYFKVEKSCGAFGIFNSRGR